MQRLKILFFLLAITFVSSCEDDVVGKWDPMKWEYKNISDGIKIIKSGGKNNGHDNFTAEIDVNKSGSIDIECKNYKRFWFQEYPNMNYEGDFFNQFYTKNCEMKIEGSTIHCEFINVELSPSDRFSVVVTAGDVFFQFIIDIN